ncbi:hypothetical protein VNO77_17937 [Canavalia gladiata]|uniref:Uncharacterized protein n=1 Tax=Canavalia gladiata TaxID=3824 RepID=A0AAN9QJ57_CANGL
MFYLQRYMESGIPTCNSNHWLPAFLPHNVLSDMEYVFPIDCAKLRITWEGSWSSTTAAQYARRLGKFAVLF